MYISLFLTSRENHCLHISFIEICATCANDLVKKWTANLSEFRGQYKLGLFFTIWVPGILGTNLLKTVQH